MGQFNHEINFTKLKNLPIYAASGLIRHKDEFYVISDDERSLYKFNLQNNFFQKIEILAGELPSDHKERKKLKPDWEAATYLQLQSGDEGILVFPSGSKPNRQIGFFLNLSDNRQKHIEIDFSKIYQILQNEFNELNIEGAAVLNSRLNLFQRGNGKNNHNAIVELDLNKILQDMNSSQFFSSDCILRMTRFNLGQLNNLPLSFTDAFAIDGFVFFLAVCEETTSTYEDGPFKGAVLGQINAEGKILNTWKLNCPFKPEGLWMEKENAGYKIFIVTDADSREQCSSLYIGTLK